MPVEIKARKRRADTLQTTPILARSTIKRYNAAEIMVPGAIYLYFIFLRIKLSRKYNSAAIVRESVTNCRGIAWNKAY
jgi:hypothetical protein